MLKIHNSQTRKKEVFTPIEPGKVRMYVCGMTVYDLCHLGHARVLVVFDAVTRYLRFSGYDVTYVRNITDIDDKIINRANENGEEFSALTERFIQAMHEDAAELGVLSPDEEPRATSSMKDIIDMVQTLVDKGHAYAAKTEAGNGDVYFDVSTFEDYGKLSGKKLEDLRAGERVAVDENKDDPLDFVLWKAAKPGEPSWDSPWGKGRPGWHIECSAMSTCCLGNHFDIHGGGQDLQFPHHENEIAQSEAATGETFVNLWMHNGFVRIDDEKMSKSLGNFFTVREILKLYKGEEIRYFVLASQYRSPLNYSDQLLDTARTALSRLYNTLRDLDVPADYDENDGAVTRFKQAMDDDFNTPEALAVIFDLANQVNKLRDTDVDAAVKKAAVLKKLANVLGLLEQDPEQFLHAAAAETDSDVDIDALIEARNTARENKDWAEADRIRDELDAMGIVLEDKDGKTVWRRS
ncbi:MAG: cysteine--tRNA ligase [Gammaproteobacteria bacterium]|nr:cysteine--tRNA ligase [Gammaproteobacteria bacterium]NNJ49679.1 cysteine--tRNA ligase [Gammaproteobacteria bacterium]